MDTIKNEMPQSNIKHNYIFSILELFFFGGALIFLLPYIPSDINHQNNSLIPLIIALTAFVFSQVFSVLKKKETTVIESFLKIVIFIIYICILYFIREYLLK